MSRPVFLSYALVKRATDLGLAAGALIVSLPIQAGVAVAVAVKLGRPVLFKQLRPGLNGRVFTLYKFRTMTTADPHRGLITDEQRLTHFGKSLRSTSLDELPTLVNVLRGDMSLVGPRPLLVSYLQKYSANQARRHEVRPGITGLAQVSGRNALSWEDRLELDVQYVERCSFLLDLSIIGRTIGAVIRRDGISAVDSVTMPEFDGVGTEES
ncbi:sugar transferase [Cryobacterium sp. Y50]|uniref:sugar transferase n=1 Tax=Cryobacterium sp. Y50 TaxID=2048286 RepID=UPI000CE2EBDD|nr:sugar transferase [Cryobacterium sp. Y50]